MTYLSESEEKQFEHDRKVLNEALSIEQAIQNYSKHAKAKIKKYNKEKGGKDNE